MHDKALSIVSSEWVLDLELVDKQTRDAFIEQLFNFVMFLRHNPTLQKARSVSPSQARASASPRPRFERLAQVVKTQDVEVELGNA